MEQKTIVKADEGKQELLITREFDLPLALLFKAFEDPNLIEQWMGTKVLKLESKSHGAYRFETTDAKGKVVFKVNGVIHSFVQDQKITRTFEMENTPYGVQLEILDFAKLTDSASKLTMHTIYESVEIRDKVLKLPFAQGINWAHNRLQEIFNNLK